jgi:subtilisin family serine protease
MAIVRKLRSRSSAQRTVLRRRWMALPVFGLLVLAAVGPAAAGWRSHGNPALLPDQGRQAGAVELTRVPARPRTSSSKLDYQLSALVNGHGSVASTVSGFHPVDLAPRVGDSVQVVIDAKQAAAVRNAVDRLGGTVQSSLHQWVTAMVPTTSLKTLSLESSVGFVRAPTRFVPAAVGGEEVAASGAPDWFAHHIMGDGVKVAIIDGGFANLPAAQASGDVPTGVTTMDFCGGNFATATSHGTAVTEIVHEMAPNAKLYLVCIATDGDLSSAEQFVKSQGVKIVNFSGGFPGEARGDGSGLSGSIVTDFRNSGGLWVNSAGNNAQTHYSANFNDPNGNGFHDFVPGVNEGNFFVFPGGGAVACAELVWDEWPTARTDLNIGFGAGGVLLFLSGGVQNGTQPPTEELCIQNTGATSTAFWAIQAQHLVGAPRMDLVSLGTGPLQYQTPAGSITDPGTSPAAFTAGAACWQSKVLEPFSSQGPTIDGRVKPDITGYDGNSGLTFGAFSSCTNYNTGFFGTSAASPNVAGEAALVWQKFPKDTPAQVQSFLETNALDVAPPGKDNQTGAGELHLGTPPDTVPPFGKALPSSGRFGRIVRLLSKASDDYGEVKITEQVKVRGHIIKTITTGFKHAEQPTTFATAWKAPKHVRGPVTHCEKSTDQAKHFSKTTCSRVLLH